MNQRRSNAVLPPGLAPGTRVLQIGPGPDDLAAFIEDTSVQVRACFRDHPSLKTARLARSYVTTHGDAADLPDPVPVLIVEPWMTAHAYRDHARTIPGPELRSFTATQLGLELLRPGAPLREIPHWHTIAGPQEAALIDPTGTPMAIFGFTPGSPWLDAAGSLGKIIVLYGINLGVGVPARMSPASWTASKQARELGDSVSRGQVVAGVISFHFDPDVAVE